MKRISSLNDLLIEEMAELLNAEGRLVKALPMMARASHSPALKALFEGHLEFKKKQANRLQEFFNNIGQDPRGRDCKAVKGLIDDAETVIKNFEKNHNRDNAIISLALQVEHYEIAVFKTAREHAADVGHSRIVELFDQILSEERSMDLHLSELAKGTMYSPANN
jgi:ferritin-like metal-binding protein YciE